MESKHRILVCILSSCFLVITFSPALYAQQSFDGCYDYRGLPVVSVPDQYLTDVAASSQVNSVPVIRYNPLVMQQLSPAARQFFYFHECAHQALGHVVRPEPDEELQADCYGAKVLSSIQGISTADIQKAADEIGSVSPGDSTHLGGQDRSNLIKKCANRYPNIEINPATVRRHPNLIPDDADEQGAPAVTLLADFKNDPEARQCADLSHPTINWHTSADFPAVDVTLTYENQCSRPIECMVAVGTVQRVKNASDIPYRAFKSAFTLKPEENTSVAGRLRWYREGKEDVPHVLLPRYSVDDSTFIHCQYIDHLNVDSSLAKITGKDAFETAVRQMAQSSSVNFSTVKGVGSTGGYYESLVKIPYNGSYQEGHFWYPRSHPQCVYDLDFPEGEQSGKDAFNKVVSRLKSALMNWQFGTTRHPGLSDENLVLAWEASNGVDADVFSYPRVRLTLDTFVPLHRICNSKCYVLHLTFIGALIVSE